MLATSYAKELCDKMEKTQEYARKNMAISAARQKDCYDRKAKEDRFAKGQAVWLLQLSRKKGISPKLTCAWKGPFVVLQALSDVTYKIQGGPKARPDTS